MAYSLNLERSGSEVNMSNRVEERIFFSAIVRNDETLVKYAQLVGNYDQVLSQVMPKVVKTNGIKMTFNYER